MAVGHKCVSHDQNIMLPIHTKGAVNFHYNRNFSFVSTNAVCTNGMCGGPVLKISEKEPDKCTNDCVGIISALIVSNSRTAEGYAINNNALCIDSRTISRFVEQIESLMVGNFDPTIFEEMKADLDEPNEKNPSSTILKFYK